MAFAEDAVGFALAAARRVRRERRGVVCAGASILVDNPVGLVCRYEFGWVGEVTGIRWGMMVYIYASEVISSQTRTELV